MDQKAINIIYLVGICAAVLVFKMAQLQIFDSKYKEQARRTTLDRTIQYPSRGLVYDRNGKLLVSNATIYDIEVIYNNIPKSIDTSEICALLEIDKETFRKNINKNWKSPRYHKSVPFVFLSKVKPEVYSRFQEHLHKYPGFYPSERSIRSYPHKHAAHVLGFLGEVDEKDIKSNDASVYRLGDYIGRSGIERTYEQLLRGQKGIEFILKDNLGRKVESFDGGNLDSSAVAGKDIVTTLDLDLQSYGEELMNHKVGSIVAIEPETGEILAMLSAPSYDPNQLSLDKNRGLFYDSLSTDTLYKPLFDRSVMAKYPPGSIFKTVFSLVAMQKGILNPNRTIYCDGVYEANSSGTYTQDCHHHPTPYNVAIALQHSCNSYYYQILREFIDTYGYTTPQVGLDTLMEGIRAFGLGSKLNVDYHTEERGYIPSSELYDRMYNGRWRSTYILSLGIGQGEIQLTTIQMANLAAIMANKGYYYTPHLLKEIKSTDQEINPLFKEKKLVGVDSSYFEYVIEGMARVTTQGTGRRAYIPGIEVCGKTGTSENPHGKDHSVFFAFAPRQNPKIAIAVFVENAGFGGDIAAPIAGLMIEKYLKGEISPSKKYLEERILNQKLVEYPQPLLSQNIKVQ